MQLAHHEDGQNTDGKITQCRKRAVDVGHGDDDMDVDAGARDGGVERGAGPEVLDGPALQQHDEHKGRPGDGCECDDAVEDPDVEAFDGDAAQEDADGDFAADGGPAVGDFAEPPVLVLELVVSIGYEGGKGIYLHGCDSLMGREISESPAGAVEGSPDHTSGKHDVP